MDTRLILTTWGLFKVYPMHATWVFYALRPHWNTAAVAGNWIRDLVLQFKLLGTYERMEFLNGTPVIVEVILLGAAAYLWVRHLCRLDTTLLQAPAEWCEEAVSVNSSVGNLNKTGQSAFYFSCLKKNHNFLSSVVDYNLPCHVNEVGTWHFSQWWCQSCLTFKGVHFLVKVINALDTLEALLTLAWLDSCIYCLFKQ